MKIAVVGASAAGLLAALLLARAGHQVVVVEQDGFDAAADLESAAATAFGPAAPQVVQPDAIMARGRELLRDRLPDLYARLLTAGLTAGLTEAPLTAFMSPALADRSPAARRPAAGHRPVHQRRPDPVRPGDRRRRPPFPAGPLAGAPAPAPAPALTSASAPAPAATPAPAPAPDRPAAPRPRHLPRAERGCRRRSGGVPRLLAGPGHDQPAR